MTAASPSWVISDAGCRNAAYKPLLSVLLYNRRQVGAFDSPSQSVESYYAANNATWRLPAKLGGAL